MEQPTFVPSLIWVIPFVCLLLGIAILPLAAPRFWESNTRVNTLFLGLGTLLASAIGTIGASMLLIRPLLHTNSERAARGPDGSLFYLSGLEHRRHVDAARPASLPRIPGKRAVYMAAPADSNLWTDHRSAPR